MKKPEKWAGQHQKPSDSKRFAKKLWRRSVRRVEKVDPEDAPKKIRFFGHIS